MKRSLIILIIVVLLIAAGVGYWYYSSDVAPINVGTGTNTNNTPSTGGFSPFDRNPIGQNSPVPNQTPIVDPSGNSTSSPAAIVAEVPVLRLLSNIPVGGYGILTLKSTTTIRWIDRGRGNVYQATNHSTEIETLSNTILPRVYDSVWNKNLSSFLGSLLDEDSETVESVYSTLQPQSASSTVQNTDTGEPLPVTPFALRGESIPDNVIAFTASPKKDRVFILVKENDRGVGYTTNFNGQNITKIFDTPLTQVNIEWPEENTIAITTKGSATQPGYLYFVNPKTGAWKKVLGPLFGLSTRTSPDAKRVIYSSIGSDNVLRTNFYTLSSKQISEAVVKTLADKCAWGHIRPETVYCAVPTKFDNAVYPDDWYLGKTSFIDKIWSINAASGEIHLVSEIVDQSKRLIDAFNLTVDESDQYLVFMNKDDLSLWSFDLVD